MNNVEQLILKVLNKKGSVKASEIVKKTGFSRVYVNRSFRKLREEGILTLIGKANNAKYIPATSENVYKEKMAIKKVFRILKNINLNEDEVLAEIKRKNGIFQNISGNVSDILDYAFTEMLNNAIEHSLSNIIEIHIEKKLNIIIFEIRDRGVGIFANIIKKRNIKTEMGAIQDLLKGKQTTEPAAHSGEGIFFTSKVGDVFTIQSSRKKIIFDNLLEDIFIRDINRETNGTRVVFSINLDSKRKINDIFSRYTDDSFQFNKTEVSIKLYKEDANYVSRSQARRLLVGLEKFKTIILNFDNINVIGQAFADEIFRVWKRFHPNKKIIIKNAGDNVIFMIKRTEDK